MTNLWLYCIKYDQQAPIKYLCLWLMVIHSLSPLHAMHALFLVHCMQMLLHMVFFYSYIDFVSFTKSKLFKLNYQMVNFSLFTMLVVYHFH
jgi:nitric oxide reductase large subunit